jgi:phosphohistidine phosphatase
MKTLLVLRHAKSSWKEPWLADHDRPLKKRGKQDAPRMGVLIRDEGLVPDIILSSTAKRAQITARVVAENCGYDGELELTRELYLADAEMYIETLRELPPEVETAMVVGHNPGLESLVEDLTGEWARMPTAALAQIALPIDSWDELDLDDQGKLVSLWRPREVN